MKKVIVTGVTGQDGSFMVDYLLKNTDFQIYGMVRRTSKPDYENIEEALKNKRFSLIVGDLSDSHSIENVVEEILPDYFINFAAQSFVGSSWNIPEQTFETGAIGVLRCLESIRKHSPQCRFYNAGSSEEFGDTIESPQDETHPFRPQSPYGAAKCAARHLVRVFRESYGLYAIQGILYNHEGIRRNEDFVTRKITKGVARIQKALINKEDFEPIELGNLDAKRDWSDAEDFVEGVWRMLNQEKYREFSKSWCLEMNTEIKEYILSSNETHTIREFVELSFKAAGLSGVWHKGILEPEEEEFILGNENGFDVLVKINPKFYRPAEVKLLHGDSTLARRELGWEPKTNFQELVKKMVNHDIKLCSKI